MISSYLKVERLSPRLIWAGLIFFSLVLLYSLSGIAMAYWIAAAPGNSEVHIRYNFIFWVTCTVFCVGINLFLIYLLRKGKTA